MDFVTIKVTSPEFLSDFLISELFQLGFDSFQELSDGFEGSIDANQFSEQSVKELLSTHDNVSYLIKKEEKINWNEEWEKNYDPIIVEDKCIVRASFHEPRPDFAYEIIVTPKMSFGTGHHATTYQVLAYQMNLDHEGKRVLDVGTGTGILAIMAEKRSAEEIVATDIDEWCIENSAENFDLNSTKNVQLIKGEIQEVQETGFDIVIANINKNILLDQIGEYSKRLKSAGELILSGFYKEDIPDLVNEASSHFLVKKTDSVKDNWAMLVLSKQSV